MGWIIVFAAIAIVSGFTIAGMFLLFLSVGTGFSEVGEGWFLLLGSLCSLGVFAWQMSIRERFRHMGAWRAKLQAERKRREDPFYEPSPFFPWRQGKRKPVIDPAWGVTSDRNDDSAPEQGPPRAF
ncbi:MAG: hypothetical protein ACLGIB_10855 [Actinomycetota bacterium]